MGFFIDRWLGTEPAFTLIGLALGLVIAFVGAYRMVTTTLRDLEREAARQKATASQQKKNDNA